MTGMDALVRSHISASHALHSGGPSDDVALGAVGFGSSAERSVGEAPPGVTVSEEGPLGIFYGSDGTSEMVMFRMEESEGRGEGVR